jgi:chaperonin GroEL (HSP60 family)
MFITKSHKIQELVIHTMERIASAVGSSMGPGGRVSLLEASQPGFPNKVTKDGVTILKNLGSTDSYEHLIIETAVSSSMRTATEAGDGTTTTCVLGYEFIKNIFDFCEKNPKESPQKVVRRMKEVVQKTLLPYIAERSIKIT